MDWVRLVLRALLLYARALRGSVLVAVRGADVFLLHFVMILLDFVG